MRTISKNKVTRAAINALSEVSLGAKGRPIDARKLDKEDLLQLQEVAVKLKEIAAKYNKDEILLTE